MFALKKNENTVSFTVRLNLNRAEHARAYELLKNSPRSRTATIVDALTAEAPALGGIADAEALKEIVRQAVSDAIRDLPLAVQPSGTEAGTTGSKEISDQNYDIADNFMNSL